MTQMHPPADLRSMTGFASSEGRFELWSWSAELRAVNGKGLDLRFRMPDWIEGLEVAARALVSERLKRGNVTLSIRVQRNEGAGTMVLSPSGLAAALDMLREIGDAAEARGVPVAPVSSADIAQLRGVLEQASDGGEETAGLRDALLADIGAMLDAMDEMRAREGAALGGVLSGQLAEITALTAQAKAQADARKADVASQLRANLAQVMEGAAGSDPDRVAQELALIAVKADVTEELDRLGAHVEAAGALLAEGRGSGRKLDFLMQEFNREANTLCAKSQNAALTRTGLALKAVIDQMREQVQNVE